MRQIPVTSYMALPGLNPGYAFEGSESKKIENIIKIVQAEYNVTYERMRSIHRYQSLVTARQVAIYLIRMHTTKSLSYIAHLFGGRDHTTAIHSITRVQNMIQTEPEFRQRILKLENLLAAG